MCLARWSHSKAETRVVNISIDLLGVGSWRHQVVMSGCILGLPGNATSSAKQMLWGTIMFYSKLSVFHLSFLQSKPCFFWKSVPLNSCYTGANQKLRWPTTVTSNTNYSHQTQITHIKNKFLTSKTNCSHQIQIAHIKYKILTSNTNYSHQKQIAHIKYKLLTSNTNCSHQK